MAPANVLQGAVREHGLASSPTPETHVRVAWAIAGVADTVNRTAKAVVNLIQILGISCSIADFVAQTRI
jgi:flavoprotein